MADKKISDFTAATTLGTGDLFEIETAAGNSRKITEANLALALAPLAFSGCSATLSADLTTINATGTYSVTWNGTDEYDTGGWHDPASNNTRITPTGVNYVDVFLHLSFTSTLATNEWVRLVIERYNSGAALQSSRDSIFFVDSHGGVKGATIALIGEPVASGDYFLGRIVTEADTSITISQNYSRFRVLGRG
jgi:hypothetical protein